MSTQAGQEAQDRAQFTSWAPVRSTAELQLGNETSANKAAEVLSSLEQEKEEAALLSPRTTAVPTGSRKIAALQDLSLCSMMAVFYLCMKAFRFIMGWLGVSEHRWKGVPNDTALTPAGQKHLLDVAANLQAAAKMPSTYSNLGISSLISSDTENSSGSSPMAPPTPASAMILGHLQDVVSALEAVANRNGIPIGDEQRSMVYTKLCKALRGLASRSAVNPQDVLKSLRHQGKGALKKLTLQVPGQRVSAISSEYVLQCLMQQSLRTPRSSSHTLITLPSGAHLQETLSLISLTPGLEYIRHQGDEFEEQAAFMTEFTAFRPSDVKKHWPAQAMAVNARQHTLCVQHSDGSTTPVCTHIRSGAFAVHGRKPKGVGLSGLLAAQQLLNAEEDPTRRAALLARLQYHSAAALEPEIRIRSVFCVAQALPVVLASLQQSCQRAECWKSAVRSGAFLHVQQSLLSDLNANEHSYLEDTKGALDLLASRLEVRFAAKPLSLLSVDKVTHRITLTLDSTQVPESAIPPILGSRELVLSRAYRLHAVLFSQGVNVLQSIGFLRVSDTQEILQDAVNTEAVEALKEYAVRAGKPAGPALLALTQHFSPVGSRAAKDAESIWLVRKATEELGGTRAVNCKSGKDRTALELCITCSQQAVEAGLLSSDQAKRLKASMHGGLSYQLTGQNNGQPNAYAFSELELVCLPSGWAPRWQLCGKVMS